MSRFWIPDGQVRTTRNTNVRCLSGNAILSLHGKRDGRNPPPVGDPRVVSAAADTWLGVPFTHEDTVKMAERNGFEARHRVGAGEERFWLWYFKR